MRWNDSIIGYCDDMTAGREDEPFLPYERTFTPPAPTLAAKLRASWEQKTPRELLRIYHNLQVAAVALDDMEQPRGAAAVREHIALVANLIDEQQERGGR